MDIAFFMGLVAGFLIGMGVCIVICKWIKRSVYDGVLDALKHKKNNRKKDTLFDDEDEDGDWWKPKGWKP